MSLLQSIPPTTANKQNSSTKEFFLTLMCGPVGYSVLCDVIYVSIYLPFDEACRAQGGEGRQGGALRLDECAQTINCVN